MQIKIDSKPKGMYSSDLSVISRQVITVVNEKDEVVGVISGSELSSQLLRYGFRIVSSTSSSTLSPI